MPVIIDEIVIALDVGNAGDAADAPALGEEERRALVAECAERVLDVLRERREP